MNARMLLVNSSDFLKKIVHFLVKSVTNWQRAAARYWNRSKFMILWDTMPKKKNLLGPRELSWLSWLLAAKKDQCLLTSAGNKAERSQIDTTNVLWLWLQRGRPIKAQFELGRLYHQVRIWKMNIAQEINRVYVLGRFLNHGIFPWRNCSL